MPLDLATLVARLPVAGLALRVLTSDLPGVPMNADPDLLTAALLNLFDNAARHGAFGYLTPEFFTLLPEGFLGRRILRHLRAHGVSATCAVKPVREMSFSERMLNPTVVDASIAELLLSHAADMDADLIVMGGYGHTRTFELVLGGVTRTLLGSMTIPVLMSH